MHNKVKRLERKKHIFKAIMNFINVKFKLKIIFLIELGIEPLTEMLIKIFNNLHYEEGN